MSFSYRKFLLFFLRAFVYIKRFFVWVLERVRIGFGRMEAVYQNTLGFRFYKVGFLFHRSFIRVWRNVEGKFFGFLGQREVLQVCVFIVAFVVMLPHTNFVQADDSQFTGRDTVFYALVGPGEEFGEIEEVVVDVTALGQKEDRSWRQGAVVSDQLVFGNEEEVSRSQDISSISVGGTAVTKPTILPGNDLPTPVEPDAVATTGRTKVVTYEVQPGDVIGAIAEKFGISVVTVLQANNLTSRSLIRPGDTLTILPTTGVVHKVARGDTVNKIARKYDTEVDKIVSFNRLKNDGSDIVIGEQLVIPDGVLPRTFVPRAPVRTTPLRRIVSPPPSAATPAGAGYIWPTSVYRITQYYGWRHTGLDIAGPSGSPLYAARAGRVIKSQCGWNGGYGCYIILDHGGGVTSLYAHARTDGMLVSVGEQVSQGQTIALMGSTGRSTGPHIHFEIRVNGRRSNPLQYIR